MSYCKICGDEIEEGWWRDCVRGKILDEKLRPTLEWRSENAQLVDYSLLYPKSAQYFCSSCFERRMGFVHTDGYYCGPLTDEDAAASLAGQISTAARSIKEIGFFSICEAELSGGQRCRYAAKHKTEIGFLCGAHTRRMKDGKEVTTKKAPKKDPDVLKMARLLLNECSIDALSASYLPA